MATVAILATTGVTLPPRHIAAAADFQTNGFRLTMLMSMNMHFELLLVCAEVQSVLQEACQTWITAIARLQQVQRGAWRYRSADLRRIKPQKIESAQVWAPVPPVTG